MDMRLRLIYSPELILADGFVGSTLKSTFPLPLGSGQTLIFPTAIRGLRNIIREEQVRAKF